eukprot:TRINITY_DN21248_c0_g1_i1.p1 TRINITY_DN21248_c0_g1~~TRINITY_DN21248_c0_g1_i1.p1  ORF type:complete len:288 (-),score=-16.65 TRINITY_DN21248_c0_g1_i1:151-1014(-)
MQKQHQKMRIYNSKRHEKSNQSNIYQIIPITPICHTICTICLKPRSLIHTKSLPSRKKRKKKRFKLLQEAVSSQLLNKNTKYTFLVDYKEQKHIKIIHNMYYQQGLEGKKEIRKNQMININISLKKTIILFQSKKGYRKAIFVKSFFRGIFYLLFILQQDKNTYRQYVNTIKLLNTVLNRFFNIIYIKFIQNKIIVFFKEILIFIIQFLRISFLPSSPYQQYMLWMILMCFYSLQSTRNVYFVFLFSNYELTASYRSLKRFFFLFLRDGSDFVCIKERGFRHIVHIV